MIIIYLNIQIYKVNNLLYINNKKILQINKYIKF